MKNWLARLILCLALLPATAVAESYDNVIRAELRPGWRLANGDHMAALHFSLAPGWKTYWRAPGDAGIPPMFNWSADGAVSRVEVLWPAPKVVWQSGMRSVTYSNEVILPLRISLQGTGARSASLSGVIDLGICKDICLPHRVRVSADLPATPRKPDPMIAAAMANLPFSASEAGVRSVRCQIAPQNGGLGLRVDVSMKGLTGREETVIETANPKVWVAEPETTVTGSTLIAQTRLRHVSGQAFALDRSGVRITILGGSMAVDIQGCDRS